MSFIYTIIERHPNCVLCEYTEYDSNFMQIARVILQKEYKQQSKYSIIYDKYKIHLIYDNNLIFLCLSEEIADDNAFAFLYDIERKFLKENDIDRINDAIAFGLRGFATVIKQYMSYYNTHPYTTKTGETINELNLSQDAIIKDSSSLFDSENKIDIIVKKTSELESFNLNIQSISSHVKTEKSKNTKTILFVCIIIIILIILFFIFQ